ncbi:MAG: chloride channel protein [Ruminococcus sp.]|nr:chloride channel protein [Ruminococcus sp.]
MSVNAANDLRSENRYIIFFMPAAGVLIAWLYHICKYDEDGGTNLIISSIRTKGHIPLRMAPLIFVSTVLTHLTGGSAGREGAALQLGGSIGSSIGELFRVKKEDAGVAVLCGMSALFSALFGTPLTATFFAMEVVSVGVIYYAALVPCLTASLTAFGVSLLMKAQPTRFDIAGHVPKLGFPSLARVSILAAVCAIVSIFFCVAMKYTHTKLEALIENKYLRAAAGGAVIVLLTLILRTTDYNGAGMQVIERAIYEGKSMPYDFLLKIIFTAITIGAGFKGGEIVPTMFIGATLGCTVSPWLGLDPCFGAAAGIAALFCSVVNCPVAAIFLSLELFGSEGVILFAAACGVSYMLSGYYGLYSSQKIVYSKLHTRYINRRTK